MKVENVIANPIYALTNSTGRSANGNAQSVGSIQGGVLPLGNGKNASGLQKMLMQMKEQIQKIKESDVPADVKSEQIKALEEEIVKLQAQIAKEKLEKAGEKNGEVKEDAATEKLREDGFSVVGKDLIQGIVSSSGSMKLASTARTQYVAAKARHDGTAMEKAMSYQTSYSAKAQKEIKSIEIPKAEISAKHDDKPRTDTSGNTAVNENNNEQGISAVDEAAQSSDSRSETQRDSKAADQKAVYSAIAEKTAAYKETVKTAARSHDKPAFDVNI